MGLWELTLPTKIPRTADGGGGGELDSAPSRRWARLIACMFEHGLRAVCGGVSSVVSLMFSNLKLLSRWFRVGLRVSIDGNVSDGYGVTPVNRGSTGSDRERWLADIPVRLVQVSELAWRGARFVAASAPCS